jgi:hypothetical protein
LQLTAIDRYFEDLDAVDASLADYIRVNLRLWDICGLLSVVERAGNRARLDNGKLADERQGLIDRRDTLKENVTKAEQAGTATDVLLNGIDDLNDKIKKLSEATQQAKSAFAEKGYVSIDRQEMELETAVFNKHGSISVQPRAEPFVVVYLGLGVAHEFAHQLSDFLLPDFSTIVNSIYERKKQSCSHKESDKHEELLTPIQVAQRHFISGHARVSTNEYWAECITAFSKKDSRDILSTFDSEIHKALTDLVLYPERYLATPWNQSVIEIRAARGIDSTTIESFLEEEQSTAFFSPDIDSATANQDENSIRKMVLEVIIRQALSGASWIGLCAGSMSKYNITTEEVEAEVQRRKVNA